MSEEPIRGVRKDLRVKSANELTQDKIDYFVNETKKYIGKEVDLDLHDKFLAEQPVESSEIRRFSLCNLDGNPLWTDTKYGKTTKWGSMIAPPLFMQSSYASEVMGTVPVQIPGILQAQHWLHAGVGLELFTPIKPGDLIKPRIIFNDIEVKTGRFAGLMFLNSTKTTCTNQRGEVLGIQKHYDMIFSIANAQEKKRYDISQDQSIPPLEKDDLGRWTNKRQGATPRYYEDVNVGDNLPSFTHTLSVMDIVGQAAALRTSIEFPQDRAGVGCHWHYNPITCYQVRALPLPFDFGQMRYTWGSRMVTDWMGDNAWVWKVDMQARTPIFAGDRTVISGKIQEKFVSDDRHCVVIDVSYLNQRNDTSCKGTFTVILPSKKGDAPLLPKQPKI
jgi:hypothetical protein